MPNTASGDRQRVLDATDIVDLVRESVSLKQRGREWIGLCPFHDDHSPSMYVVPAKNIFHCFVCGAGGNAIDWMMRLHRATFPEALEQLAQRAGLELTPFGKRNGSRADAAPNAVLLAACELATRFYAHTLAQTAAGSASRTTLERRGVRSETIDSFALGCAPDAWDALLQVASRKGVASDALERAGLVKKRERSAGHYDILRNRLVFPIHDRLGRVVAFGGRRLREGAVEDVGPKYLNTPETPIFDKSTTMYGLHHAINAIRKRDHVVVVEGYMDVIACHQAGFAHVVATMGTALTEGHARMLSRLCSTATLVFDADDAGQRAAERAVETFFAHPIDIRIAVLPGDDDPDDVLRRPDGRQALSTLFDQAQDALAFRFGRLAARLASAGPAATSRAIEDEVARLVELGLRDVAPVRRRLVARRLARAAHVEEADIIEVIQTSERKGGARAAQASRVESFERPQNDAPTQARRAPTKSTRALQRAATDVLACLLCDPGLRVQLAAGETPEPSDFIAPEAIQAARAHTQATRAADLEHAPEPSLSAVLERLDDPAARAHAAGLVARIERETGQDQNRIAHRLASSATALRRCRMMLEAGATLDLAQSAPNDVCEGDRATPDASAIVEALQRRQSLQRECGGNPLALPRTERAPRSLTKPARAVHNGSSDA